MSESVTTNPPKTPVEQLMTFPWVQTVRATEAPDATYIIELRVSTVEVDTHIQAVKDVGATDIAIAAHGDYGQRLYVTLP